MPTWVHVGANIGPCWLKKTVLAGLGPFWRPLGPSCLEAGGGSGGAQPPQHCKRIDLRGVLRRFEASSRPLGGANVLTCYRRWRCGGGPLDPFRGIQAEIQGLQILILRGIQQKAPACTQALRRAGARWRIQINVFDHV